MSKSSLLKNARNYAEYLRKKVRGPVKAFFHITKNENVPAIEQQGLLTNHPNANINSANHPFRKHGTDAGGVWVTTEPTAFPVYGTTIGGKHGNASARADALSTIKIEVPLPELAKMRAVEDPYGRNILHRGDDPDAIDLSTTWAGIDVPTTVLLDDIKPEWLKNIGYVEEKAPPHLFANRDYRARDIAGSWQLSKDNLLRMLDKSRLRDYSGLTGHRHDKPKDAAKSSYRFVEDYLDKNQPITKRLPIFPRPMLLEDAAHIQGASSGPKYVQDGIADVPAPNEANRYSVGFIPAHRWSEVYRDYVKPGKSINSTSTFEFAPGAISRGMGGEHMLPLKDRNFNWPKYKKLIAAGASPSEAARSAVPDYVLDWDNIVYHNVRGYGPKHVVIDNTNAGHISAGTPRGHVQDVVTGKYLVNPNDQGAIDQFQQLGPDDIESLKNYNAYDDIVKDKDHPTWQELVRVIMRINAGTATPYW